MGEIGGPMKRQLNVNEQCELLRRKIIENTTELRAGRMSWLESLLTSKDQVPLGGVLAEYHSVTEQEGEFVSGLWLNARREFFAFEGLLTGEQTSFSIERWEEVTESVVVSAHLPGKGHSIGSSAINILEQGVET